MSDSAYAQPFARLRSDVKPYWPATTFHRAPHKPMLLLAVMDLIANQHITCNLIALDAELIDAFDRYWHAAIGDARESNILMPFFHLSSEDFWHLIALPGKEAALALGGKLRTARQFADLVRGARLDDELFALLQAPAQRDELRRILIERYFAPELRPAIVRAGAITGESFEYSRELLDRAKGRFTLEEAPTTESYQTEARSVGFRRVVIDAYAHTCAFCRIRVLTPAGRTAVAAAHIVPWSHSRNDDPRNGLALCGLHHWSFDHGLVGVDTEYRLLVSPVAAAEGNAAGALLELNGQPIVLPRETNLLPARSALRWHLNNIFWREVPPRLG